jgi:DNA processing protein
VIDTIIGIEERAEHADRLARITLSALDPTYLAGNVTGAEYVDPTDALARLMEQHGYVTDAARSIDAEAILNKGTADGYRYVIPGDAEWPKQLDLLRGITHNGVAGVPLGLWVRGPHNLAEFTADAVAVVGSRSCTTYGGDVATDMAGGLVERDLTVVSGGAYGIDVAAHRGALAAGYRTVAVLACGVDVAYPAAHSRLLDRIATDGLVVSEFGPGSAPTRTRFLARNRVIAALSRGTVLVEAAHRSGTLNTAAWTRKTGRTLMAVPGPVTAATSQGCHDLIQSGHAQLVTSAADVFTTLAKNL